MLPQALSCMSSPPSSAMQDHFRSRAPSPPIPIVTATLATVDFQRSVSLSCAVLPHLHARPGGFRMCRLVRRAQWPTRTAAGERSSSSSLSQKQRTGHKRFERGAAALPSTGADCSISDQPAGPRAHARMYGRQDRGCISERFFYVSHPLQVYAADHLFFFTLGEGGI